MGKLLSTVERHEALSERIPIEVRDQEEGGEGEGGVRVNRCKSRQRGA